MRAPRRSVAETKMRAVVLTNYFDVAKQLGLNPQPLLRKAGLSRALLSQPDQHLSSGTVVELLEASARESRCDSFGLMMAESRHYSDFGAISLLISHQRTLHDVFQATSRYRHLVNDALALYVEKVGKTVILRQEVITDVPQVTRQATELAIGVTFLMCRSLLGAQWQPISVNFTHQAPSALQVHRRVFKCKLVFDSTFNGIVCPAHVLELANPMADPLMAGYAERFLESLPEDDAHSVGREVRRAIYLLLPMGRASIKQIAQSLGLSVRSLQRQLDDGGENFSEQVNGVRQQLALRYMENRAYSLGRICEQLGYTKPSSFTRWFTAQFGVTPTGWRAKRE